MRHLAFLLGLLLVVASLPADHGPAGGAVSTELKPAGALLVPTDALARSGIRAEAEPCEPASDAGMRSVARSFPTAAAQMIQCADAACLSARYATLSPNPARAPPRFS